MRLERDAGALEAFTYLPCLLSHFWRRGSIIEYGPCLCESWALWRQGGTGERCVRGGDSDGEATVSDGEAAVSAIPGVCLVLRMIKCKSFWSPKISKQ